MPIAFVGATALCVSASLAQGQTPPPQPAPKLDFRYEKAPRDSASAGRVLRVHVEIAPGWHINSDAPLDEFLVPTAVEARAEGREFGKPRFPKPERVHSQAMGGDMLLFSGSFDIEVPVRAKAAGPRAEGKDAPRTRVVLRYQACDHATCFPPKEVAVEH